MDSCSGLSGSVLDSGEAGCLLPSLVCTAEVTQGYQHRTSQSKDLKSEGSGVTHFRAVIHGTLLWPFTDKAEFGVLIWKVDVYFHDTSQGVLNS